MHWVYLSVLDNVIEKFVTSVLDYHDDKLQSLNDIMSTLTFLQW